MPSPALLQALSRLDQAVAHAEAALDSRPAGAARPDAARDNAVRQAMAELDDLIEALDGRAHG